MRSIVRLAAILAFAGVVFGSGIAAGAAGSALLLGRANDAGASRTTLKANTSDSTLSVQQLGSGPAISVSSGSSRASALKITRGAIEVDGAGMNTPTAAFLTKVPGGFGNPSGVCRPSNASQLPDLWRLDNPVLDDSPGAMVFVQRLFKPGDWNFSLDQAEVAYYLPEASGGCGGGHWYLESRGTAEGVDRRVAVLVLKP